MTEPELVALIKIYQADHGNQEVLGRITEECLYLVKYAARAIWSKISQTGATTLTSEEDLENEGFLGLLGALNAFDPNKRVKFTTYAPSRIRGAILDYLRRLDGSRTARGHLNKFLRAQELSGKENPDPEDIQKALDVTEKVAGRIFRAVILIGKTQFLSTPTYEKEAGGVAELGDSIPDSESTEQRNFIATENFYQLLKGFSREEKIILLLYYSEDLTMKDIGTHLNLSESRISQMHSSIIRRLRNKFREEKGGRLTRSA